MHEVLIIDDSDGTFTFCRDFLSDEFHFHYLRNGLNLDKYLTRNHIDLILLDKNFEELPDDELVGPPADKYSEGLHILGRIKKIDTSIPVMIITSYGDMTSAEEAIELGAYDYIESNMLSKGETLLRNRMLNAIRQSAEDPGALVERFKRLGMVGLSPVTLKLFSAIENAARSDDLVLLLGPTGTGKDLAAETIHSLSARKEGQFINCSLPERTASLMESELFGVEKKAATDVDFRKGYFELASGGTLLLNEIGDFPLELQAKLLRVLEEKSIYRVGGSTPIKTNFRLICATNKDLKKAVENDQFREDLYYRINSISIYLPPLSERVEDIRSLVHSIIDDTAQRLGIERPEISDKAIEALMNRQWPGNIRELKHVVEHVVNTSGGVITLGTLASEMIGAKKKDEGSLTVGNSQFLNDKTIADIERELIEYNHNKYNGDIDKIARSTGISRTKLYERLKQYGLR